MRLLRWRRLPAHVRRLTTAAGVDGFGKEGMTA
jgi:hypothetical protein